MWKVKLLFCLLTQKRQFWYVLFLGIVYMPLALFFLFKISGFRAFLSKPMAIVLHSIANRCCLKRIWICKYKHTTLFSSFHSHLNGLKSRVPNQWASNCFNTKIIHVFFGITRMKEELLIKRTTIFFFLLMKWWSIFEMITFYLINSSLLSKRKKDQ